MTNAYFIKAPQYSGVQKLDVVVQADKLTVSVEFEGLKCSTDFGLDSFSLNEKDLQVYVIPFKFSGMDLNKSVTIGRPINTNTVTFPEKINTKMAYSGSQELQLVRLYCRASLNKTGFTGANFVLAIPDFSIATINAEVTQVPTEQELTLRNELLNPPRFTLPEIIMGADSSVLIPVINTGTDHSIKMYLTTNAGYLPKQQVDLAPNSSADIKFMSTGLEYGDVCEVGIGSYNFPKIWKILVKVN